VLRELGRPFEPPAPKSAARVGQIIIRGNDSIPDNVIRRELRFYPGQVVVYADLRKAEEALRSMKDLKNERGAITLHPTITVLETEGDYKDIIVNIHEMWESRAEQSKSDIPDDFKKASFVLDLPFKGVLLAFDAFAVLPDGRVRLTKAFVKQRDLKTNRVTSASAQHLILTLNQPVRSVHELPLGEIRAIEIGGPGVIDGDGRTPIADDMHFQTLLAERDRVLADRKNRENAKGRNHERGTSRLPKSPFRDFVILRDKSRLARSLHFHLQFSSCDQIAIG